MQAGRAAFDYDRIGTGASSHPLSTELTIDSEAYVLHQIVSWLRASEGYSQVNLIGHSLGSVISIQEAGITPTSAGSSSPACCTCRNRRRIRFDAALAAVSGRAGSAVLRPRS